MVLVLCVCMSVCYHSNDNNVHYDTQIKVYTWEYIVSISCITRGEYLKPSVQSYVESKNVNATDCGCKGQKLSK